MDALSFDLVARYCAIGFLAGVVAGGLGVWALQPGPETTDRPAVQEDSTELAWGELEAGALPDLTTAYQPGPLTEGCMPVPLELIDRSAPEPDTVTKYRTRFASTPGPSSPAVDWSSQVGLEALASSRYPFLFLPLLEDGRPAIDHDGQSTTVQAYGQNGRGYTFTYRYRPPTFKLFVETWAAGQWWPPLTPRPRAVQVRAGVDLGLRYRMGAGRSLRLQAGPQFSSRVGPGVRAKLAWRPWSTSR